MRNLVGSLSGFGLLLMLLPLAGLALCAVTQPARAVEGRGDSTLDAPGHAEPHLTVTARRWTQRATITYTDDQLRARFQGRPLSTTLGPVSLGSEAAASSSDPLLESVGPVLPSVSRWRHELVAGHDGGFAVRSRPDEPDEADASWPHSAKVLLGKNTASMEMRQVVSASSQGASGAARFALTTASPIRRVIWLRDGQREHTSFEAQSSESREIDAAALLTARGTIVIDADADGVASALRLSVRQTENGARCELTVHAPERAPNADTEATADLSVRLRLYSTAAEEDRIIELLGEVTAP